MDYLVPVYDEIPHNLFVIRPHSDGADGHIVCIHSFEIEDDLSVQHLYRILGRLAFSESCQNYLKRSLSLGRNDYLQIPFGVSYCTATHEPVLAFSAPSEDDIPRLILQQMLTIDYYLMTR